MIFHEFIYEFIYEIFATTLLGTPEFIVFHEIMPDTMDFGLFSKERSYQKSCLKNIVNNIVKNIVKRWKICMNSSSNSWRGTMTRHIWWGQDILSLLLQ